MGCPEAMKDVTVSFGQNTVFYRTPGGRAENGAGTKEPVNFEKMMREKYAGASGINTTTDVSAAGTSFVAAGADIERLGVMSQMKIMDEFDMFEMQDELDSEISFDELETLDGIVEEQISQLG